MFANLKLLHAFTIRSVRKVKLQDNALYKLSLQDIFCSLPIFAMGLKAIHFSPHKIECEKYGVLLLEQFSGS